MFRMKNTLFSALALAALSATAAGGQFSSFVGTDPIEFWGQSENWSAGVPFLVTDTAFVGPSLPASNTTVWLDNNVFIGSALITDGMRIDARNRRFLIARFGLPNPVLIINGANQLGDTLRRSRLRLTPAQDVDFQHYAPTTSLEDGGALELDNGAEFTAYTALVIDEESLLEGNGSVLVQGSGEEAFDNNGTVRAVDGTLTIEVTSEDGLLDLDGSDGTGVLRVENGATLEILGAHADPFHGEIYVGSNASMSFDQELFTGGGLSPARIVLDGAPGAPAVLDASDRFVAHRAQVDVFGDARIDAHYKHEHSATLDLASDSRLTIVGDSWLQLGTATVGDNAILDFAGGLTQAVTADLQLGGGLVRGGHYRNSAPMGIRGHGRFESRLTNNTLVSADGGTLVLDGTAGGNDWDGTDDNGQLLALTGDLHIIGTPGIHSFRGDIRIGEGHEFSTEFENGVLIMQEESHLQLFGGSLRHNSNFFVQGAVDVFVNSTLNSSVQFSDTASVQLGADLTLIDDAFHSIQAGASFTGGGTLINDEGVILSLHDEVELNVNLRNNGRLWLHQRATVDAPLENAGEISLTINGATAEFNDLLTTSGTFTSTNGVFRIGVGNYDPVRGDAFDLLDFATFVDQGHTFDLPALTPGLAWDTSTFTTDGVLRVGLLIGDMNCDGAVTVGDINPFVLAITDPAAYTAQFPDCDIDAGDCNSDGDITVGDINCFVALVTGG